jgi:hypothetical protein
MYRNKLFSDWLIPSSEYFSDKSYDEKLYVIQHYMFTLCLENRREPDYCSEKTFQALLVGSLPLSDTPNVADLVPNCSTINVYSYNMDNLVKYLQKMVDDPKEYQKWFEWKKNMNQPYFKRIWECRDDTYVDRLKKLVD